MARAAILVLLAGLIVALSAHAQKAAIPHDWWLIEQTLDAKTLVIKSEKRMREFEEWSDCVKAQAGRVSRVADGAVHIYVCRHFEGEVST